MAIRQNRYTQLIEKIFLTHYRLVSPDELTYQELESYRKRSAE
ncbi:MAG: hypothetical protein AB1894_13150 [Chloroflexota bacterium]